MDEPQGPINPGETQILFGKMVVSRGLATQGQIDFCLKRQAELSARGDHRNLGELLVDQGALTADQVKRLLGDQDKVILICPLCSEKYNVLRSWSDKAECPQDGEPLQEPKSKADVGVAATLMKEEPASPIGMEIGGCRIIESIGKGATGSVWKARHKGLSRYVAVKLMPSVSENPQLLKRLLLEARTVAKLEHANIVQVYDVGYQKGYFFMVMQLLRGRSLEEEWVARKVIPTVELLNFGQHVARGLEAAHSKGIIHRDVKPANIMVSDDGMARLTDFGLASDSEVPDEHAGSIVGTPYYMAPEQWLGHGADERSDLYSLGVILYQMVTGTRPFEGDTVAELMRQHLKTVPRPLKTLDPSLSDGLCAVIKKLMAKAPKRRYTTATLLLEDLVKVDGGSDPEAMAEFGKRVKCGFCETFNSTQETKCTVCGESLRTVEGPLELATRADEFKCPGCGAMVRKGSRACTQCGNAFCVRCRRRLAVLKDHCHYCVTR